MKTCINCKISRELEQFNLAPYKVSCFYGLRNVCKICQNEQKRKNYSENREQRLKQVRIWQKENSGRNVAKSIKYRMSKMMRTPKWLTKEHLLEMEQMYIKAAELTKITGIKYEVDHIIPLRGKNISGLHVPWNLQILSKTENVKKRNRF
jgi:hypothetical protein